MRRKLIQHLNDTKQLEQASFEVLQSNLLRARDRLEEKLPKIYTESTSNLRKEINAIVGATMEGGKVMPITQYFKVGQDQGIETVADIGKIPKSSIFFAFKPQLNTRAISLVNSEYTQLIKGLSDGLKTDILRAIQAEVAQGSGITEVANAVLGEGLQSQAGRGGAFRPSTVRAAAIARTVTNDILNRGALDTYKQLNKEFPELQLKKEWVTTSDRRTSDRCESLNKQVRELEEPFEAQDGWRGINPPSHGNCRSRVVTTQPPTPHPLPKTRDPSAKPAVAPSTKAVEKALKATEGNKMDFSRPAAEQAKEWHKVRDQEFRDRWDHLKETTLKPTIDKFNAAPSGPLKAQLKTEIMQIAADDPEINRIFEPFFRHLEGSPSRWATDVAKANTKKKSIRLSPMSGGVLKDAELDSITSRVYDLTKGKIDPSKLRYKRINDRAGTLPDGLVDIGKVADRDDLKSVLYHEIGHHLEFNDPRVAKQSVDFIKSHATSDKPEKLSKLTGHAGYEDDEVAYPGKFISPYAGKVYPEGYSADPSIPGELTEITAMGLERFRSKAEIIRLYGKHRDHFWHMVGILGL